MSGRRMKGRRWMPAVLVAAALLGAAPAGAAREVVSTAEISSLLPNGRDVQETLGAGKWRSDTYPEWHADLEPCSEATTYVTVSVERRFTPIDEESTTLVAVASGVRRLVGDSAGEYLSFVRQALDGCPTVTVEDEHISFELADGPRVGSGTIWVRRQSDAGTEGARLDGWLAYAAVGSDVVAVRTLDTHSADQAAVARFLRRAVERARAGTKRPGAAVGAGAAALLAALGTLAVAGVAAELLMRRQRRAARALLDAMSAHVRAERERAELLVAGTTGAVRKLGDGQQAWWGEVVSALASQVAADGAAMLAIVGDLLQPGAVVGDVDVVAVATAESAVGAVVTVGDVLNEVVAEDPMLPGEADVAVAAHVVLREGSLYGVLLVVRRTGGPLDDDCLDWLRRAARLVGGLGEQAVPAVPPVPEGQPA